ncbi:MAG: MotA/TolQ/ExbB proton channel family protein [Zoogloeaceae bacterium]|nr:MotA/TolQ/ExbB proton channel family protein [Zoogloeaceae bacterium]
MENAQGFAHFLATSDFVARAVLTLLLLASTATWYLILSKGARLFWMKRKSAAFIEAFWDAPNLEAVAARIRENGAMEPFSHLVHHGFTALEQSARRNQGEAATLMNSGAADDLITRALKRAIDEDRSRLEFGQTLLATVASAAPFAGLFGTVWGIYHALLAIGASGQSSLDAVAGPVGEALIMTAIGLAVALPASVAYNAFARANRNLLARLDAFAYDVFAFLATGIKTSPMRADARATSDKVMELARAARLAPRRTHSHEGA